MQIGSGAHTYEWIENWAKIPDSPSGRANGRTHGVAVNRAGEVIVFNQADPAVLFFGPRGNLMRSWGDRFPGAHGLTLVEEDGHELLWLTDHDTKEVVKVTPDGRTLLNIRPPEHPVYKTARYAPTWVAVNEERFGGNGDIWVTDGYGSGWVHRYGKAGNYLASINGAEGEAGAFDCPHALWTDTRRGEPELYIADRGNHRIQVYDFEGRYKRVAAADILTSPCTFRSSGKLLVLPELHARLAILDEDDKLVCYLGSNEEAVGRDGWPNLPAHQIEPGRFNSPHDLAVDPGGNIYVVEWIIGGRITKLAKV
jgi:DNA-binding beta-propeller fold protein YncE